MKNKVYLFTIIALFSISSYHCSTTKKVTLTAPAEAELTAAQKRWPSTTQASLNEGYTIFTTRCTKCHALKDIGTRTEDKWMSVLDKMAPRAKLTAEEKETLTHYILAKHDLLAAGGK